MSSSLGSSKSSSTGQCPPCVTDPAAPCYWGWDAVGKHWWQLNGFGGYPFASCTGENCAATGQWCFCGDPNVIGLVGEFNGQVIALNCRWMPE
jgi:hypothetical protein